MGGHELAAGAVDDQRRCLHVAKPRQEGVAREAVGSGPLAAHRAVGRLLAVRAQEVDEATGEELEIDARPVAAVLLPELDQMRAVLLLGDVAVDRLVERAALRVAVVPRLLEDDAPHAFRMRGGEFHRYLRARPGAVEVHPLQLHRVEEPERGLSELRDRRVGLGGIVGVPVPGSAHRDHARPTGEPREVRLEVVGGARRGVEHNEGVAGLAHPSPLDRAVRRLGEATEQTQRPAGGHRSLLARGFRMLRLPEATAAGAPSQRGAPAHL